MLRTLHAHSQRYSRIVVNCKFKKKKKMVFDRLKFTPSNVRPPLILVHESSTLRNVFPRRLDPQN